MAQFFLSSHGRLASGIKTSVNILLGGSDNLTVFDAYVDEKNLEDALNDFFEKTGEKEQKVLLSDLYGGSVNNTMYTYLDRPNTYLIAGVNLALVISLIMEEDITPELLDDLVMQGREALQVVTLDTSEEEEEELF